VERLRQEFERDREFNVLWDGQGYLLARRAVEIAQFDQPVDDENRR